jgi:TRAP-type C4-dicarboxylate transport system permease small subunit
MKNKHLIILTVATLIVFFYTLFFAYVGQSIRHPEVEGVTTIFGLHRAWLGSALVPALCGTLFPFLLYFFYIRPKMQAE